MFKLESSEQFHELVKQYKILHKRPDTNCYFFPDEIENYVRAGQLYGVRNDKILYFFIARETFYQLYFYLGKEETTIWEEVDKTVVLDFVFRGANAEEKVKSQYKKFGDIGFTEHKTYCRMNVKKEEKDKTKKERVCLAEGFSIESKDPKYACDIVSLWESQLDIYSTPLPSIEEVQDNIRNGKLSYIVDEEQKLCAALQYSVKGTSCMFEHLAVSHLRKRKGLGHLLLSNAIRDMVNQGVSQWFLWVDIKNEPALKLYRKCGFVEDTMVSKQFIYKSKNKGE